ncbi:MAG: IspD/TarI family cytidylyltransferase [Candidatus Ratteibacteria bacterium]|jgi:2-C-methyl-D-erythritol 4-phosphate cytidylyltransferase
MNIALITAGGSGKRTNQDIPKQFIKVNDKPIVAYTMEVFQRHSEIDAIEVVCLDGWHDVLKTCARQFNINKLKWVISGGASGQESVRNGVYNLKDKCAPDDIVVIHDGVRPLVGEDVISDCIVKCRTYGNAVASFPHNEQIYKVKDEVSTEQYIPRETIRCAQTPNAYKYAKLLWAYQEAFKKGIGIYGSSCPSTMMMDLGETVYFSVGSNKNIKITTIDDIELFKALLCLRKTTV